MLLILSGKNVLINVTIILCLLDRNDTYYLFVYILYSIDISYNNNIIYNK